MIRLCLTSLIDAEHHRNGHFAGYNYNISGNDDQYKEEKLS